MRDWPQDTAALDEQLGEVIAGFLDAVAAGDRPDRAVLLTRYPALAAELEEFFANHDALHHLAEPPGSRLAHLDTGRRSDDTPGRGQRSAIVGQRLGDYLIVEEIARGGMGVVCRALQLSLNRTVALKMILAGALADREHIERFRAEAEAAASLDHPHIVPIYEVNESAGRHYFSMKLIEGENLRERLITGGLRQWLKTDAAAAARQQRLLVQVLATAARAVHYAHQRGILHRDLKPANILIDQQGQAHVTDFGLAKRVTNDQSLTESGMAVGTPSYMAPEQATGRKGAVTTASDIWSLGAILYEILTGRAPFLAETALETMRQVLELEPTSPRARVPWLDRDLEIICLKCLEKPPQRRYVTAEALADDLERWLRGESIQARPTTTWERGIRWARRRPVIVGLVGAVVGAVLMGAVGMSILWWNSEGHRQDAASKARLAQALNEVNQSFLLVSQNKDLKKPGMQPLRKQLLEAALSYYEEFDRQRGADPKTQAELAVAYFRVGVIAYQVGAREKAIEAFQKAAAHQEKLLAQQPADTVLQVQVADTYRQLGATHSDLGEQAIAVQLIQRSHDVFARLLEGDPRQADWLTGQAECTVYLSHLQKVQGFRREAETLRQKAGELLDRLGTQPPKTPRYDLVRAELLAEAGEHHRAAGITSVALTQLREARDLFNLLIEAEPEKPELVYKLGIVENNLGAALLEGGERAAALRCLEAARRRLEQDVADNPAVPDQKQALGTVLMTLAGALYLDGKPAAALAAAEGARVLLHGLTQAHPREPVYLAGLAKAWNTLGKLQMREKHDAEALRSFEEARRLEEQLVVLEPETPAYAGRLMRTHNELGVLYARKNELVKAISSHQRAIELGEGLILLSPEVVAHQRELAIYYNNLGMALGQDKRNLEAVVALRQAVQIQELLVSQYPDYKNPRPLLRGYVTNLARVQRDLGHLSDAAANLLRCQELFPQSPNDQYRAAAELARCAAAPARGGAALSEAERRERDRCADLAIDALRGAFALGFADLKSLENNTAFAVVKTRPDYQALVVEQRAKMK